MHFCHVCFALDAGSEIFQSNSVAYIPLLHSWTASDECYQSLTVLLLLISFNGITFSEKEFVNVNFWGLWYRPH